MQLHRVNYLVYGDPIILPASTVKPEDIMTLQSTVVLGDAFNVLSNLPDNFVRTVITSPPYWSLRDYDIPGQIGLEENPAEYIASLVPETPHA